MENHIENFVENFDKLGLKINNQLVTGDDFENKLKTLTELLTQEVYLLLLNDFPKLIQLAYRIDLDEKEFQLCLEGNDLKYSAFLLAKSLIKRELIKIDYRNRSI